MIQLQPGLHSYKIDIENHKIFFKYKYVPDKYNLIIFLHGLACSGDSFRHLFDFDYFPDTSLLVPDLAGFGRSSKSDDFSYSMEQQANLCGKLLKMFSFNRLHIVAHSMGNAVALLLDKDILSRMESFANLEGNLIGEDCGLLSRGIIEYSYDEYQKSGFKKYQKEFTGHAQLRFDQTTAAAVYKSAQSLIKWSDSNELLNRYKNLVSKKCYFWGEENYSMPVLRALEGLDKIMIPNSGHGMMTDNPEEFYRALRKFILR